MANERGLERTIHSISLPMPTPEDSINNVIYEFDIDVLPVGELHTYLWHRN